MATQTPLQSAPVAVGTSAVAAHTASTTAGEFSILRHITVVNETAVQVKISVAVNNSTAVAAGKYLAKDYVIEPRELWQWDGLLNLAGHATTPDRVVVISDAASSCTALCGAVKWAP